MTLGHHHGPAVLFAILGITVGLAACGSSDARGTPTVPSAPAAVAVTVTATGPASSVVPATTAQAPDMTDAEVADLEKQLDDVDQLLAGVDADLKQD